MSTEGENEAIKFAVVPGKESRVVRLFFDPNESYFHTDSGATIGGRSVVVNYLNLWFDDQGRVHLVSGFCSLNRGQRTAHLPPPYSDASLVLIEPAPHSFIDGEGMRLDEWEDYWQAYEARGGWYCIGDPAEQGDQAAEFARESVAVVRGDRLVALWLRPELRAAQIERFDPRDVLPQSGSSLRERPRSLWDNVRQLLDL